MNNLSAKMQKRLDEWKKNIRPVPSAEKVKVGNYVQRKNYCDEVEDPSKSAKPLTEKGK